MWVWLNLCISQAKRAVIFWLSIQIIKTYDYPHDAFQVFCLSNYTRTFLISTWSPKVVDINVLLWRIWYFLLLCSKEILEYHWDWSIFPSDLHSLCLDKRKPVNLENLSHEQTVKNSAVQIENKDKGPEDQGPKPENHLSAIQVDTICKDSTCDAIIQKERPMSPETLALMSEEKDILFHPDASSDSVLNSGCHSDVYVEQEKVVLVKLRDFLNSLITSGKAKGKVIWYPFAIYNVNTSSLSRKQYVDISNIPPPLPLRLPQPNKPPYSLPKKCNFLCFWQWFMLLEKGGMMGTLPLWKMTGCNFW